MTMIFHFNTIESHQLLYMCMNDNRICDRINYQFINICICFTLFCVSSIHEINLVFIANAYTV